MAASQDPQKLSSVKLSPLPPFKPDLYERAWCSVPHPTLPLLATAHGKSVTVFSLTTQTSHSKLTGGHARSVRSLSWKPNLPPHQLCLVTGSFDSTAGLWRWDGDEAAAVGGGAGAGQRGTDDDDGVALATEVTAASLRSAPARDPDADSDADADPNDWEFTLVLEGHDSEIKAALFSPSGAHLATCSRDQTVWVWEDVGASERDDEWETVAVLNEHDGDMKSLAWCPDVPNRDNPGAAVYGSDVLASASYDNTVRVWREDADGEWVCVAVLEGHTATVWGVCWEARPRADGRFPRLLTYSADRTIRVWTLRQQQDLTAQAAGGDHQGEAAAAGGGFGRGLGGIPNTMRQSLREDWYCADILPAAHTRDIYSVGWSAKSGLVASTGSDGMIVVYGEGEAEATDQASAGEPHTNGQANGVSTTTTGRWRVLETVRGAHGPYEINHVTWCPRYDAGAERKGEEEMLVSSGDEGLVKPWRVTTS